MTEPAETHENRPGAVDGPGPNAAIMPAAGPAKGDLLQGSPARINLLEDTGEEARGPATPIEAVRLDSNDTVVLPFTDATTRAVVHYIDDPECRGYVHCNGPGCAMCRAGKRPDERLLLPVYSPSTRSVAVLPMARSSRPGALLPKVKAALRSGGRVALLIHKPDRVTFDVKSVPLTDAMDDGAEAVAAFVRLWDADEVDLGSIYLRMPDEDLAELPSIATLLKFQSGARG